MPYKIHFLSTEYLIDELVDENVCGDAQTRSEISLKKPVEACCPVSANESCAI
jgi:hypothetical protein